MAQKKIRKRKKKGTPSARNCCVYVIDLKKSVLEDKKFLKKNPDYVPGKPVVYVGQSSKSPEERFHQHLAGVRSSKWAKRYGRRLRSDEGSVGLTRKTAERRERRLAAALRARGWGVWMK